MVTLSSKFLLVVFFFLPVKWREKVSWGNLRAAELLLSLPWWPTGVSVLLFKVAVRALSQ